LKSKLIIKSIGELEQEGVIKEIQDGNHGEKHPKSIDFVSKGIPFITARDMKDNFLHLDTCNFLLKKQADFLRIGFAKTGDVLLTHKATMGRVAIVPEIDDYIMLSPQVTYYRIENDKINCKFLFYAFQDHFFQQQLHSFSEQTTRNYLGIIEQRNLKIIFHDRDSQDNIVKILSELDSTIQNLQNQNKVLEQMAQAIFKSWFVDFDGVTEFEDSELGKIPKGWSIKQIKDFCKVRRGASPRPVGDPKYFGGDIPWIKIADVSKSPSPYLFSTKETVTEEGAKKSVHLPKNSLIISNSGTVGKPIFLTRDGCIHDGWLYFENLIKISQEFLYFHILTLTTHLNLIGDGTVQKNLNTTMIGEIKFVCPEKKYLDSFLKISQIFLKTIKENQIKINTLISIRDTFLPKLMSGEIRV